MAIWTHARWTVKPGREEDFLHALRAVADEAAVVGAQPLNAGGVRLLRDRAQPNVFLTFGSWESVERAERFSEFVSPRLGPVQELLDEFEAFTLEEVQVG